MANDNRTVAEIAKEMRHANVLYGANDSFRPMTRFEKALLKLYSDCIEVAHRREVDELEAKLANTETARKFFAKRLDGAKKQIAELRECLRIIRDNLLSYTIKSADGKYVNNGGFLSEEFVDDERWRKALEGANDD